MNVRARISLIALAILAVLLLASNLREVERRKEADAKRDKAIATLTETNDKVAQKVAEYLVLLDQAKAAAEKTGREVTTTREELLESLKGTLPPEVIKKAIEIADKQQKQQQGKAGPPGPAGPQGPPGTSAQATTTTTGATTTTRPPPTTTTTTRPPPTTTTTRCTVSLLGLVKAGCR